MGLYQWWMHRRERILTAKDTNRRVFPFEWGLEWLAPENHSADPLAELHQIADAVLQDSQSFFAPPPLGPVQREGDRLSFATPAPGSVPENNMVDCRIFEAQGSSCAVVVAPQWNADAHSHVTLCRLLQRLGITAVRHCLPYHEKRAPDGMVRADLLVSPNIGRTLQGIRQAVLELRQIVEHLYREGYRHVGVVGTSVGSCIAYLAFTHDPRIQVGVFNHVSALFADVVWKGLATRHVRRGLEGRISFADLRRCWAPISPLHHVFRLKNDPRPHLLITAKYDLTFLPHLTEQVFQEYRRHGLNPDVARLPCGHYTTAHFPFNYLDGWHICRYLRLHLGRPSGVASHLIPPKSF